MNLICPRCQITNVSDALFCKNCGTAFSVQPIRTNSISTPVIIIIAVVAVCGFCGLFGLLSKERKTEVAKPANSYVASTPPANTSEDASSVRNLVETLNSSNTGQTKNTKLATVIGENVNLRETANSNGAVIQTVPKDAEIEVIRQKGAWFYVSAGGRTGWLHGNTIRLADGYKSESSTTVVDGSSSSTRSPKSKTKNSGSGEDSNDTDVVSNPSSSRYITGPRGGCYYINGNGNKTYVNRSLCGGADTSDKSSSSSSSSSGGYIRGPRGGCFYYTGSGRKQYVDRSLCN